MLYMLDTDTASYVIRGRAPPVEAKLSAIEPCMVCISVMGVRHKSGDHARRASQ